MKHAEELLDNVWKQRRDIWLKTYKPTLRIWMNKFDVQTLMFEKMELFMRDDLSRSRYPTRLFGEELIVSDDTPIGQPVVEQVQT